MTRPKKAGKLKGEMRDCDFQKVAGRNLFSNGMFAQGFSSEA